MPRNIEQNSYRDHEVFLGNFPFMEPVRLFGEVPEFGHYVDNGRDIYPPNAAMRDIHEAFLYELYRLKVPMPYATGGIKKGSPARNIKPHTSSRYFCLMDLKGAYEQVDLFTLAHVLVGNGLDSDVVLVEEFLERYCKTPNGSGLSTGAPSSPMLFNIACQQLDQSLGLVCSEYSLVYTRYLDDLTFSTPERDAQDQGVIGRGKRKVIRRVIEDAGFAVNNKKTRNLDLKKGPVVITGLQLNPSGFFQLPTSSLEEITTEFRDARYQERKSEAEWSRLAGLFGSLLSSVDMSRGSRSKPESEAIRWFGRNKYSHRRQIQWERDIRARQAQRDNPRFVDEWGDEPF